MGSASFLDRFLSVAVGLLDFAGGVLNLAFVFHGLVAEDLAGRLFDLALHFLDVAFNLIFVHGVFRMRLGRSAA